MSTYSRQRDSRDVRVPRNDRNDFIQGRGQRDSNTSNTKSKSRPYESRPYESRPYESRPYESRPYDSSEPRVIAPRVIAPRVIAPRMQIPVPVPVVPVPVAPAPVPSDVLSEADLRILDAAPKQLRIPRVFVHHTSDYIRKCFNQYIATIEADASNVQLTQCDGYQTAVIVVEKWRQTQTAVEICRKLITNERDNKIIHGPNAAYWFIQPVITSTSAHKGKGSGIRKATLAHHYHDALDKMAQLNMENVELRERNAEMMELLAAHGIRYQPDMIYTQHCRDQAADKLMTIEELELAEEDSITTASDTDVTIGNTAEAEDEEDEAEEDEDEDNIVVVV